MTLLYVCIGLLWLMVIGLCVVVFAMARQIGLLHERIAPVGALMNQSSLEVGSLAPQLKGRRLNGESVVVGGPLLPGAAQLLLFISSNCPVCKKIIPLAKLVARAEKLSLIFVGDASEAEQRTLIEAHSLDGYEFINGPEVGIAFQVDKLPYAVLLDDTGHIVSRGIVNTREHLESLAVARQTGYSSAQAYLQAAMQSQPASQ